jgi:hypothetical protein
MLHNQLDLDFEVVEAIEAVGKLMATDWRAVFTSPNRYVPATENGRVRFVIDQWNRSADVMRAALTTISK